MGVSVTDKVVTRVGIERDNGGFRKGNIMSFRRGETWDVVATGEGFGEVFSRVVKHESRSGGRGVN